MLLKELKPRKALNKAFLKVKPNRTEIEGFKTHLIALLDRTNDTESEEFHKNLVSDFLKDTYYKQNHFINTKGRNDLVIHNGTTASATVGVIIEAKKPTNKAEMMTTKKLNTKAFQELVLYYLRERITHKNLEVKHLVVTNINEWFIFDATLFDRLFAQNKNLVQQFNDFEAGRLADTKTDFFYRQIAEPFIDSITAEIEVTYFNIQDYQKPLRNTEKADDNTLIALFKLLSPEHLLKLPFTNDSNSLDKRFYSELLHIIGLTETKEGGKKLIERNKAGERNSGAILEDTIIQLDSLDKLNRLDRPGQYGSTQQERLFNVALQLSITWINRVLFLKLLEAQLISYHKPAGQSAKADNNPYSFLNLSKIKSYDDLNSLFFQVLARRYHERNDDVKKLFEKVPYLNSSLFEPTDLEQVTLFISNLRDDKTIPILPTTVLKDQQGKKLTGNLRTLDYLFAFLNAYDFSSEGSEEIQEDNKTLINASVLGLIFEKINGYKDGSIFTPGFITMYMSRETIRKAVVQKFNEAKGWNCKNFEELKEDIAEEIKAGNRKEVRKWANAIINSLKIIDPAVGSGHFLVSVLNELIAIKSELKILVDANFEPLSNYTVEVVNDELIVTDEDGIFFQYTPRFSTLEGGLKGGESQRVQETLFHEKQTIIENCLFGVDINPNSVKICRLRLWIELLKNTYYKNATELETLPNIDINIKCGNSLVSRFAIDADLKQALKKSKWTIDSYRVAVATYRNSENKEEKREMERLIENIKTDFRSEIESPFKKKISEARGKAEALAVKILNLKTFGENADKQMLADHEKAVEVLAKLEKERDEVIANKIYENAFEWRFEFPEVLNDEGDFVGFDVVIGNPPYVNSKGEKFESSFKSYALENYKTSKYQIDTYILFIEKAINLMNEKGYMTYITPNAWLNNLFLSEVRKYFIENMNLTEICNMPSSVFEEAAVDTIILSGNKSKQVIDTKIKSYTVNGFDLVNQFKQTDFLLNQNNSINIFLNSKAHVLLRKIEDNAKKLEDFTSIARGVGVYHKRVGHTKELISQDPYQSKEKKDNTFVPYLRGKNIRRFIIDWRNDSFISYGKWLAEPREPKYFEGNRILLRQIPGDKLIAAFIDSKFITDQSVFIARFENDEIDPAGVLGIINSKLLAFYFKNKYSEFDDLFPKVKLQHFKDFPIRTSPKQIFNSIVLSVLSIQSKKSNDPNFDLAMLETQIDKLVYQLYDLNQEEINIIETA